MRLTVLCDNSTLTDRYLLAEPAVSFLIEDGPARILFDVGYSDVFLRNAASLGQNLTDLDHLVLSHGHLDHSWGLADLIRLRTAQACEGRTPRRPVLTAHPDVLSARRCGPVSQIGFALNAATLAAHFDLNLTALPCRIAEHVDFLGAVPRRNDFEAPVAVGETFESHPDIIPDDTGLVLTTAQGLVVVTGCSHSGICNLVDHARALHPGQPVIDIIGGFHLLQAPAQRLQATADHLRSLDLPVMHPCHCTDFAARLALAQAAPVADVGSGLILEWN